LLIDVNDELCIPMYTHGTNIQFLSRTLTVSEPQTCPRVIMTSPMAWNPTQVILSEATSTPPYRQCSHISGVYYIKSWLCTPV
jgi:hypothetical protein